MINIFNFLKIKKKYLNVLCYQKFNLKLKVELDHQYEAWKDTINKGLENLRSWYDFYEFAKKSEAYFKNKIQKARTRLILDENVPKKSSRLLKNELDQFRVELNQKLDNFCDLLHEQALDLRIPEIDFYDSDDEQLGLTFQRIRQFEQFQADESFVDDQCVICMEDIEVGRHMMRLNCDGQHTFCQVCIKGWFADHRTCPVCRHRF